MLGRIGGKCYDHRRAVLLGWIVGVIAIIAVASTIGSRFENNFGGVGQSQQAQTLLAQRFPTQAGDNAQVVFRSSGAIDAPEVISRVDQRARRDPHAAFGDRRCRRWSGRSDGHTAFATVQFDAITAKLPATDVQRVIDKAESYAAA